MMFKIALVCDGTSDLCLLELITWLMDEHYPEIAFITVAAREVVPARGSLQTRLYKAAALHAPTMILCHRDAEGMALNQRVQEINTASAGVGVPIVPVVPVRMLEAWLLLDETAIRRAADNGQGTTPLNLPSVAQLESKADPKEILLDALKTASELSARRKRSFNQHRARSMVLAHMEDFSILRGLDAFRAFEERFCGTVDSLM